MTEMIAAEPYLAERLLRALADPDGAAARLAAAVARTASAGDLIVVAGCGTSEHGGLATVEVFRDALRAAALPHGPGQPVAAQAFEASLAPQSGGLVIGVSHEGATWATNRALETARAAGAQVALVTVSDRSPAARIADPALVVVTRELDQSWCHTVGYVSPILAATAVGARIAGRPVDAAAVRALMAAGTADPAPAEALASAIAGAGHLIVIASGADLPAGRELVLKVEEASWLPSAFRDFETFLHGHLPATDDSTALVLILADRAARDERVARARQALEAARIVGIRAGAILAAGASAALDAALTPAGRIVVPEAPDLPTPVAALLGTATPLQLLTERLARARGTNPDPIRRDDSGYRDAAAAAE